MTLDGAGRPRPTARDAGGADAPRSALIAGGRSFAVTGAGGFIGGAVCRAIIASGGPVVALGRGQVAAHPALRHVPGLIEDTDALARELRGVGVLIHAAGRGTPAAVDRLDGPVAAAELRLTAQVLEAAIQAGVRKVIVVSSGGTVYGNTNELACVPEHQAVRPISRYGAVKAMIEQMALTLARAGLLDCVVARVANPYGPGQMNLRGQGLIATMIEQLLRGRTIPIWGDGSVVRDYIYVDDVARGLVAAAKLPAGAVCNVSSGIGRTVNEVIADVAGALGRTAQTQMIPRDGGVQRNVLSNALLSAQTGWRPVVGWQDGLRRTADWWLAGDDRLELEQARESANG